MLLWIVNIGTRRQCSKFLGTCWVGVSYLWLCLSIPTMISGFGDSLIFRVQLCQTFIILYREEPLRILDAGQIWKMDVHPRVSLFFWKVAWRRLPTTSFFIARGVHLQSICPECDTDAEILEHVLFLCPRASQVWQIARLDGVIFQVEDILSSFLEFLRQCQRSQDRSHWHSTCLHCLSYLVDQEQTSFDSRRCLARVTLEQACIHAEEILNMTSSTMETWGPQLARQAIRWIFIS